MTRALLAGLVFVAACSSTFVFDSDKLEDELEGWISQTLGVSTSVNCPSNIKAEAGHEFLCSVKSADGSANVLVRVLNSEGDIKFELTG